MDMRRLLVLVVALFVMAALPAGAVVEVELSPGCQAINTWGVFDDVFPYLPDATFEVIDDTSFYAGEVVTVVGTGGNAPTPVVGVGVIYDDGQDFLDGGPEQYSYEFSGDETGFAGVALNGAQGVAACQPAPDADGDGVIDANDVCPGTVLPDTVDDLKPNRYAADADGLFVGAGYTVADTGGCSGDQIIAAADLGKGHERFGITRSALGAWIAGLG